MSTTTSTLDVVRSALTTPTNGVIGLVDELLTASREHGLLLVWNNDQVCVQFRNGGPSESIESPLRKSVMRAVLARVAVLCNQRKSNSVTPYGGKGELAIDGNPPTVVRVEFVNTVDEHRLELTPSL